MVTECECMVRMRGRQGETRNYMFPAPAHGLWLTAHQFTDSDDISIMSEHLLPSKGIHT